MPTYRAYLLDRGDNTVGVQLLSCPNDDAAIATAKPFLDLHDIVLWDGERMVVRLKRDCEWNDAAYGSLRPPQASHRQPPPRESRTPARR